MHRVGIHPVTKEELHAWNAAEKIVVTSHYGFVYSEPNQTSQAVSDVVAGNRLKWEGSKGAYYKVCLLYTSTAKVEELIHELKEQYTIAVSYTHLDVYKRQPFSQVWSLDLR